MNPEEEVDVAEDVEAVAATVMVVVVMIAMEVGVMDLAVEDLVEMPVDLAEAEAPVEERKSSTWTMTWRISQLWVKPYIRY